MTDDIVTRLVEWAKRLHDADVANNWPLVLEAADEIERLRAAGDDLAKSLAEFCDPWDEMRVMRWQEARRG